MGNDDMSGKPTPSQIDKLRQAWKKLIDQVFSSKTMKYMWKQLRKMAVEVIEVNSAMVELKRTSNASASQIGKYFEEAAAGAKKYGTSVSGLIHATAEWSRLGYGLPDARKLAEAAALFANIGDGIDISAANTTLSSTLQGFQMNADEALHVLDAFNEVAKTEAIDSAGIAAALQQSASAMHAAGNTLEETIGLVTAANAVGWDPGAIGTAYEAISMRIRGARAEMEELGLETDGMAGSTAALQREIMALSGVNIMRDANSLKSTYQILDELAVKWKDLTGVQQTAVAKLIAGDGQGSFFPDLMAHFETARRAADTAVHSTGSALEAQKEYEQGIQYSLDRLEASFQTFANHLLDSSFIKGIVDFGNTILNVMDRVTTKFGSLGTVGLGVGLFTGLKNVGKPKTSGFKYLFECADSMSVLLDTVV